MTNKEYKLEIDPRILELLGPSLYTNIYYVLAELIANAYDADAKNVYIIADENSVTVEDDGKGMSYNAGEINKYLHVATVSRKTDEESLTASGRRKMGRKGIGKLAALSVSENVYIKTISENTHEKSGFILSRYINENKLLKPLPEEEITFEKITDTSGTSVVMMKPEYKLHSTLKAIKRNLLKIFPLVSKDFVIHIFRGDSSIKIDDFDKEMISELSALITLGDDFSYLTEHFNTKFEDRRSDLQKIKKAIYIPIEMENIYEVKKDYWVEIHGWIGSYISTRGRKAELTDFPDNFISIYANKKMGEFNIIPLVGTNKMTEVFVVGQLHIDILELTELPDIALSNRQGYKSDDPRYKAVLDYVRKTLLPEIISMRTLYASLTKTDKKREKDKRLEEYEKKLKASVDKFKKNASSKATKRISERLGNIDQGTSNDIKSIVEQEINENSPDMGIKKIIDSQKRKILISQTYLDKDLSDTIYNMLLFNNVPPEDIIYSNCDDETSRIPEGAVGQNGIYNYLRKFFVDSYSTQKMFVIFVTSHDMKRSWGALTEVGAAWITQVEHKIFNIRDFRPEHPLDDETQWHSSSREEQTNTLRMSNLSVDIFAQKIEYICDVLGYMKKTRQENKNQLGTLVTVVGR